MSGTNVVDDLVFSVKSLIIVFYYHEISASLHNLDEFMSVLSFEKDNLLSLTNVCKTYILNTKQIRTNCISRNVKDDRFWKIIIDCHWNSNLDRFFNHNRWLVHHYYYQYFYHIVVVNFIRGGNWSFIEKMSFILTITVLSLPMVNPAFSIQVLLKGWVLF